MIWVEDGDYGERKDGGNGRVEVVVVSEQFIKSNRTVTAATVYLTRTIYMGRSVADTSS